MPRCITTLPEDVDPTHVDDLKTELFKLAVNLSNYTEVSISMGLLPEGGYKKTTKFTNHKERQVRYKNRNL